MLNEVDFPALDRARKGANFDGHDETSSGERPAQRYPGVESWPKKPNIVFDVSQRSDLSDDVRAVITRERVHPGGTIRAELEPGLSGKYRRRGPFVERLLQVLRFA